MTQEQFDAMMEDYERRHALPVPDSTPVDWEKGGVDWATEGGLMAGDGTGNLMLHSPADAGAVLRDAENGITKSGTNSDEKARERVKISSRAFPVCASFLNLVYLRNSL